jgi:hypothetical protein
VISVTNRQDFDAREFVVSEAASQHIEQIEITKLLDATMQKASTT